MGSEKVARDNIHTCFWSGLALGVIGAGLAIATWPRTELGFAGTAETGSAMWSLIWLAVAWLGNMVMLVGIVGLGVRFGREASPLASDVAARGDQGQA